MPCPHANGATEQLSGGRNRLPRTDESARLEKSRDYQERSAFEFSHILVRERV
jgi:hypothetical protein